LVVGVSRKTSRMAEGRTRGRAEVRSLIVRQRGWAEVGGELVEDDWEEKE
jgi:hypothetical protein